MMHKPTMIVHQRELTMKTSQTTVSQQLRISKVRHEPRPAFPTAGKRFQPLRRRPGQRTAPLALDQARQELRQRLEAAADSIQTISSHDLASLVSALALVEIALPSEPVTQSETDQRETDAYQGIPAESVADFTCDDDLDSEAEANRQASERFLWRRQQEQLWRTHLTKDEFHRPVVRSLGVPVMCVVDQVRNGLSWDAVCKLYPGLIHDEIRASVSMATECGWISPEDY